MAMCRPKEQLEFPIGGVMIKFPFNPYPPQKAMMFKIVKALNSRTNALLESPTGSGKSLALLCSALAWQKQECQTIAHKEVQDRLEAAKASTCTCECHVKKEPPSSSTSAFTSSTIPVCSKSPDKKHTSPITIDLTLDNSQEKTPQNTSMTSPISSSKISPTKLSIASLPQSNPNQISQLPSVSQNDSNQVPLCKSSSIAQPFSMPQSSSNQVPPSTKFSITELPSLLPSESVKDGSLLIGMHQPIRNESQVGTSSLTGSSCCKSPDKENSIVQEDKTVVKAEAGDVSKENKGKGKATNEDDDFKPSKKRYRKPAKAAAGPKTKKSKKGIVYENASDNDNSEKEEHPELAPDSKGQAQWRMEFNAPGGMAPSIGIPQSQIMDTGAISVDSTQSGNAATPPSAPADVSTSKLELISPVLPMKCSQCACAAAAAKPSKSPDSDHVKRLGYPKIFFATRTHKQISQISRELGKTAYSSTRMCILASREHTCIHPDVSKSKNKNDECKKLLEYDSGVSCPYFHRVHQKLGSQAQVVQQGLTTAWDIEDLVHVGKRVKACPYFATRGLVEEADIIFCPYNYLVDPMIREQMLIDLQNKVIILDEAHNIEDCARDAASLTINSEELAEVTKEINDIVPYCTTYVQAYHHLNALIKAIIRWVDITAKTLPARGYEQAYGVWNGQDFLPVLDKEFGINPLTLTTYKGNLTIATEAALDKNKEHEEEENGKKKPPEPTLSIMTLNRIKSVLLVLDFMFKDNKKHLLDYRVSLIKTTALRPKTDNWIKRGRKKSFEKIWVYSLNFWCLNPAVAFQDLTRCHSIILTSGTLSPLTTFASELGTDFPIQLEANHVIHESQTWVRSVSRGPNGIPLSATYQNSETFEFKDELGQLVLDVCETVPYGVLCFTSSYSMLDKLTARWQETDTWHKILANKHIIVEPRSGGREEFERAMTTFYQVISDAEQTLDQSGNGTQLTGALFLAVCRGKVSEGLDFTDNNARAVITIGIPFPNIKNKQIELKREYNNEHCHSRRLLTGNQWYEIQAYRALNQALGRCLRHKKDWGALILVDARYSKGAHYINGLSKWVRQRINHEADFKRCMVSLKEFSAQMMRKDAEMSMNDSKYTSVSEKSPNSSICTASSMASPHKAGSHSLSFSSASVPTTQFLLNSPSSCIPEQFHISSPNPDSMSEKSHLSPASPIPTLGPLHISSPIPASEKVHVSSPHPASGQFHVSSPNLTLMDVPVTSIPIAAKPSIPLPVLLPGPFHPNMGLYNEILQTASSGYIVPVTSQNPLGSPQVHGIIKNHCSIASATSAPDENASTSAHDDTLNETLKNESYLQQPAVISTDSTLIQQPAVISTDATLMQQPAVIYTDATLMVSKSLPEAPIRIPDTPPSSQSPSESPLMFEGVDKGIGNKCEEAPCHEIVQVDNSSSAKGSNGKSELPLEVVEDQKDKCEEIIKQSNTISSSLSSSNGPRTRRANIRRANCIKDDAIRCACGEILVASEASAERIDLKKALSKTFGNIQSSKLSSFIQSKKKRGKIEALLVPKDNIRFSLKEGDGEYNSIWEEKLGLCYGLIHCKSKCKDQIGILILATKAPTSSELIGKVILSVHDNHTTVY